MSQMERDKNALRRLFNTKLEPMDMQTILLHAGENIQPAVKDLVKSGELILMSVDDRTFYTFSHKLKPYKP